jgi:diphthamide synthase (EF-2-diphthine--ammonia ligase)
MKVLVAYSGGKDSQVSGSLPLMKGHICFDKGHSMYKLHEHKNHQSDFSSHKCMRCGYEEDYQYDFPRL